jgi:hypothetical protein
MAWFCGLDKPRNGVIRHSFQPPYSGAFADGLGTTPFSWRMEETDALRNTRENFVPFGFDIQRKWFDVPETNTA